MASVVRASPAAAVASRSSIRCSATKVLTKTELSAAGGKKVVELNGQRVLIASDGDAIFAVNNKCSHLGLPLVGKTALLQGKIQDKCIVCPAHGTAYDLATGQVKGKWCPSLPEQLSNPFGATPPKPIPTYKVTVADNGDILVEM